MARIARVVVPGIAHHVVQRGVRRMDVFFSAEDREEYIHQLHEQGERFGVRYLAWCLMTNHVHLIAIPESQSGLAQGIGEAHRRYTRYINFREGWRGYLFQGRFHSCPLDGSYLLAAIRYVLRNPVRAGIVIQPWDYEWSSARWLIGMSNSDPLAAASPALDDTTDWRAFLSMSEIEGDEIRKRTRTGRPLGSDRFLERLELLTGRLLRPMKPGPKTGS
ncbi:transposase [Candidatus Bipolaricaulota bacterium]